MSDYVVASCDRIIPAENPTIAYIQWHLHSAVLLDVSCIDRMNGIDGNEMHLASKSASSGRRKIPLSFYLKSDRFGDFWASEWFEGILRPPELWNHQKALENSWNMSICCRIIVFPYVFWYFCQKYCYFVRRMQDVLRHTDGVIQKPCIFLVCFWYFWILHFRK